VERAITSLAIADKLLPEDHEAADDMGVLLNRLADLQIRLTSGASVLNMQTGEIKHYPGTWADNFPDDDSED
jgi:hypothetical protein